MSDERDLRRKSDVLAVLRRAGVSEQTVEALDDPVDVNRDADVFVRHGITLGQLIDRMGGSP